MKVFEEFMVRLIPGLVFMFVYLSVLSIEEWLQGEWGNRKRER